MHLVTGGSASGKSEYAEGLVLNFGNFPRIYLATMKCHDEETRLRIERHRIMRSQKQFLTIECFYGLESLTLPANGFGIKPVVLLECVSNLTANEMWEKGGAPEEIAERVVHGVKHLQNQAEGLIIVTNEIFSDGVDYEEDTKNYLRVLGRINQRLAAMADQVTEVVSGIPIRIKTETV